MNTIPVNPNAQKEVKDLLEYFNKIEGKVFLTGQHTQTRKQELFQVQMKLKRIKFLGSGT